LKMATPGKIQKQESTNNEVLKIYSKQTRHNLLRKFYTNRYVPMRRVDS
jgi:hypothetical protein